jgi:PAS domain S-box-containing protein
MARDALDPPTLLAGIADGVVAHDPETGTILAVNEPYCDLLGYTESELVGEDISLVTAEEPLHASEESLHASENSSHAAAEPTHSDGPVRSVETMQARLQRAEDEGSVRFEWDNERRTGERIPLEANTRLQSHEDGPVAVTTVRELSERRAREERQRELVAEYETVFRHVTDSLFLIDVEYPDGEPTFRLRRLNPANRELFGVEPGEVTGKTTREAFGAETGAELRANYERCLETAEPISIEEEIELDGETRQFQTTISPVEIDGRITHLVGVAHDITQRTRRERELEVQYDRLHALFANSQAAIVEYVIEDGEPIVEDVNDRFEELFGYDTEEVVGRSIDDFIIPPESREAFEASRLNAQIERGEDPQAEVDRRTADGMRTFTLRNAPINTENETRGYAIYTDITDRKEREQELDLLGQVLSRVLRHNVRNDLTVIRGYGEMFAEQLDGKQQRRAETLVRKADDLVDISDKARTIERLIGEEQSPREMDLVTMLREIAASVEQSIPEATVRLETPEDCRVVTTPSLEPAFENLVENAVEHDDSDSPAVLVTLTSEDDAAVVTISDEGPGIPELELGALDADEETPLQHGSGVGLWVVQWAIEQSDATIEYETGSGGTEIVVRIPI